MAAAACCAAVYVAVCGELHLTLLNNTLLRYGGGAGFGSRALQHYLETRRDLPPRDSTLLTSSLPQSEVLDDSGGGLNASSLWRRTDAHTRPLMVRAAFADAPALHKWTLRYLAEEICPEPVPLEVRIDPTLPRGTYAERIRSFERGEVNQVNQVFYSYLHAGQQRRIVEDLGGAERVARAFPGYTGGGLVAITINVYRSKTAGGVAWHTHLIEAPTTIQIKGRKHWRLAPPEASFLMRPDPSWMGAVLFSSHAKYSYRGDPTAPGNIDSKIPRIGHVLNHSRQVEARPGDLLFTPAAWWHSTWNVVESQEEEQDEDGGDADSDVVISVVFSFGSVGATLLRTAPDYYPLMIFCLAYIAACEVPRVVWVGAAGCCFWRRRRRGQKMVTAPLLLLLLLLPLLFLATPCSSSRTLLSTRLSHETQGRLRTCVLVLRHAALAPDPLSPEEAKASSLCRSFSQGLSPTTVSVQVACPPAGGGDGGAQGQHDSSSTCPNSVARSVRELLAKKLRLRDERRLGVGNSLSQPGFLTIDVFESLHDDEYELGEAGRHSSGGDPFEETSTVIRRRIEHVIATQWAGLPLRLAAQAGRGSSSSSSSESAGHPAAALTVVFNATSMTTIDLGCDALVRHAFPPSDRTIHQALGCIAKVRDVCTEAVLGPTAAAAAARKGAAEESAAVWANRIWRPPMWPSVLARQILAGVGGAVAMDALSSRPFDRSQLSLLLCSATAARDATFVRLLCAFGADPREPCPRRLDPAAVQEWGPPEAEPEHKEQRHQDQNQEGQEQHYPARTTPLTLASAPTTVSIPILRIFQTALGGVAGSRCAMLGGDASSANVPSAAAAAAASQSDFTFPGGKGLLSDLVDVLDASYWAQEVLPSLDGDGGDGGDGGGDSTSSSSSNRRRGSRRSRRTAGTAAVVSLKSGQCPEPASSAATGGDQAQKRRRLKREGFVVLEEAVAPEDIAELLETIRAVRARGFPTVFAFVYDVAWRVACQLTRRIRSAQLLGGGGGGSGRRGGGGGGWHQQHQYQHHHQQQQQPGNNRVKRGAASPQLLVLPHFWAWWVESHLGPSQRGDRKAAAAAAAAAAACSEGAPSNDAACTVRGSTGGSDDHDNYDHGGGGGGGGDGNGVSVGGGVEELPWPPHQDRPGSLYADGTPMSVTAWLAVTRVRRSVNSAIHYIPASRDPDYGRSGKKATTAATAAAMDESTAGAAGALGGGGGGGGATAAAGPSGAREWSPALARLGQAAEADPGDLLVWTQETLHWASGWEDGLKTDEEKTATTMPTSTADSSPGAAQYSGGGGGWPRVSISIELQRSDAPSSLDKHGMAFPVSHVPSLNERLRLVGLQLLHYQHMLRRPLSPALLGIAQHLAVLPADN